jgi:hypothetical protein
MMITSRFEVEFRKDGAIHDEAQVGQLLDGLGDATDLVVISHGWNNDRREAGDLYDAFARSAGEVAGAGVVPGAAGRRLAFLQVFWPSKKFADADLIPGGGAASATAANDAALLRLLDELAHDPVRLGGADVDPARRPHVERARQLVDQLASREAQREYVQALRAILNPDDAHEDDGSAEFFALDPVVLFENLSGPVSVAVEAGGGGATSLEGGAAGFVGDLLDGATAAARRIANFATYYQMKSRAGTVGRGGLALVLGRVRARRADLPLHLVGHSFGGRLVTAAAAALPSGSRAVSLTLLQAAFSHNGLAERYDGTRDGAFRTVLRDRRVSGPVLVTHTRNDRAVGVAYPLASRIARDVAAALGDENDPYGGIGRNGALRTPEAVAGTLLEVGTAYRFERDRVFNLRADRFVRGHSDVTGHQVAAAFLHALAATPA